MIPRLAAVALCVASLGGCAAGMLPPSRTDVGSVTAVTSGQGPASGMRVSVGSHTASATTSAKAQWDVGAGYVFESSERGFNDESTIERKVVTPEGEDGADTGASAHGGYFEVGRAIERRSNSRLWLGGRAEFLVDGGGRKRASSTTALARANYEIFANGSGAGGGSSACGFAAGMAYGSVGAGVYMEAGARMYGDGETAFLTTAGLSLRLPFLAGVGVSTCR